MFEEEEEKSEGKEEDTVEEMRTLSSRISSMIICTIVRSGSTGARALTTSQYLGSGCTIS